MEGHCSTGQSPQWAVVPMEEEEEERVTLREERVTLREVSSSEQNRTQNITSIPNTIKR